MFVSSSRLFILFNGPPSLFQHRPSALLRLTHGHTLTCPLHPLSSVHPPSRTNSHFPIKSSQQFHSQSTSNALQENNHVPADAYLVTSSHPWPEWSDLLRSISIAGYFDVNRNMKDEFVPNESLSMEFLDAACSCLGFAHDRPEILGWLPKDDIQVLIDDGAPFLFKSAHETERRMKSFLQAEETNEATTVDLMKYILSYASNPIIYPERNIRGATESSARNLLKEMANFSGRGEALSMPTMGKFNGAGDDEQTPRNLGGNSTMKRGDWICPKCSFKNLAKNTNCLECKELRPQRQLTGSEWDCPRCNFFNNGRNAICLKCECTRPGEVPFPIGNNNLMESNKDRETSLNRNQDQSHRNNSTQDAIKDYAPFVPLPADMFAKKPENTKINDTEEAIPKNSNPKATFFVSKSEKSVKKVENRIKDAAEEEKSEKWFKKVAELHDVTDLASAISDEDFPEIMPMRKGENRFVVSKKKDRSLTSPAYKRKQAMEQTSNGNFVPFVPFPPDYFAKKDDKQPSESSSSTETRNQETSSTGSVNSRSSDASSSNMILNSSGIQVNRGSTRPETAYDGQEKGIMSSSGSRIFNQKYGTDHADPPRDVRNEWEGKSLEGSAVKETDPLDMSEEAKAERWFRRVAQIKDISELTEIPDEDFPSIMPMRKGVNRFVVSKRKTPLERRLTAPQYRKNSRTVSSNSTNKEGHVS